MFNKKEIDKLAKRVRRLEEHVSSIEGLLIAVLEADAVAVEFVPAKELKAQLSKKLH